MGRAAIAVPAVCSRYASCLRKTCAGRENETRVALGHGYRSEALVPDFQNARDPSVALMRAWLLLIVLLGLGVLLWQRQDIERGPVRRAEAQRVEPGRPESPVKSGAAAALPAVANSPHIEDPPAADETSLLDVALAAMHAAQLDQPCLAGTARKAEARKVSIHRWVDESGILHFSDQAPLGNARGHRRIEVDGLPPIVVNASGYDVNLPDFLAQRAVADAQAIERILRGTLGVDGDPGLVLNVEFIASAQSYAQRVGNPLMTASEGTYSMADRTIHVRLQDQNEANFEILRHEITHALIHERIGSLPTALNEGMAGYFERLEVSGLGARVEINESIASLRSAAVEGDGRDELVDLLARDGLLFYAAGREQRYLRAYALIAVLMGNPDGRQALGAVLAAQRSAPCRPIASERLLDERYPGGLAKLATDWAGWLRDPPRTVQAY